MGKGSLLGDQHTPTCLPTAVSPFKIDQGNMITPQLLPIPTSDSPFGAPHVPASEMGQEKTVTFQDSPVPMVCHTPPVTRYKGGELPVYITG